MQQDRHSRRAQAQVLAAEATMRGLKGRIGVGVVAEEESDARRRRNTVARRRAHNKTARAARVRQRRRA